MSARTIIQADKGAPQAPNLIQQKGTGRCRFFGANNRSSLQLIFNSLIIGIIVILTFIEYCYRPVHLVYKNRLYVVKSSVRIDQEGKHSAYFDVDPSASSVVVEMDESDFNKIGSFDSTTKKTPYSIDTRPQLVLFTTWKESEEKSKIYEGTLKLWNHWYPHILPLLYSNSKSVFLNATGAQWRVLPPKSNPKCRGPPLFPVMFETCMANYNSHFYGFANADIAFGNGLMSTLKFLMENRTYHKVPSLVVGRRTFFNFSHYDKPITSPDTVTELMKGGESVHWSSDYFITSKNFPWKDVIRLSVGRPLFCRWIISFALMSNIPVIDASNTIEALHLTTTDGNRSSFMDYPGKKCNYKAVAKSKFKVKMQLGRVECATLETYFDDDGNVRIRRRKASNEECPAAYNSDIRSYWRNF